MRGRFGKLEQGLFGWMAAVVLLSWLAAFGAEVKPAADKAREIEDSLVAPCCWTQPVSQHDSEVAAQIRDEVRTMLAEGRSREQILDFYIAKYGERILVTPRAKGFNSLAYILPWAALPIGVSILILLLRRWRAAAPAPASVPQSATVADSRYNAIIEREMKELDE